MKLRYTILLVLAMIIQMGVVAQYRGEVKSARDSQSIAGVNIRIKGQQVSFVSDSKGQFSLHNVQENDTLLFSNIGYEPLEMPLFGKGKYLYVFLRGSANVLEQIEINTGYQKVPKERATGSFYHIDSALLHRSVSSNILERLEGVSSGLSFNRENASLESTGRLEMRVRGVSTIFSDNSPLIIVDNFPYEGDITRINPNDIASVTILKDAAASSIWGARAGNGVIVIETKEGRSRAGVKVSVNSTFSHTPKPDLYYSPGFIAAADYIDLERLLFDRGNYRENDRTVLTPVVELLFEHKKGNISDEELDAELNVLKQYDVRDEAKRYVYRNESLLQQALSFSGGNEKSTFYTGVAWDQKAGFNIGNDNRRYTFNGNHNYKFNERLSIGTRFGFTSDKVITNGLRIDQLTGNTLYPYARLVDEEGNYLVTPRQLRQKYKDSMEGMGLLDWDFRPLQERDVNDQRTMSNEIRLGLDFTYKIWDGLSIALKGQYMQTQARNHTMYDKDSHFTRNLINTYTKNGISEVPYGSILETGSSGLQNYAGRAQLSYAKTFVKEHEVSAIAGYEISHRQAEVYPGGRQYGYDPETRTNNSMLNYLQFYPTLPSGSARIPTLGASNSLIRDRMVSYYANTSYNYARRYLLSASLRWDASNLFGVRTNQRGVPLWSVGASWNIHEENFKLPKLINTLKLRATYGRSGNINKTVSTVPIVRYTTSGLTGLPTGIIMSVGNPDLRWEQVSTLNFGLDFAALQRRISGSFEFYDKTARDLIGDDYLDPTTGIFETAGRFEISNRINYASLQTRGFDLELNTVNLNGKLRWSSHLLLSKSANKVIKYTANEAASVRDYFPTTFNAPPVEGLSRDVLYAFPWQGLNIEGMPQVLVADELSTDYSRYITSIRPDDLLVMGSRIPPWTVFLRQEFQYKKFDFSLNVSGRFGGVMRTNSIEYGKLMSGGIVHRDYYQRWQERGDENKTYVPAIPERTDSNRDLIYQNSEILVESSDNIRLRDIRLGYTWAKANSSRLPRFIQSINLYIYAKDLGLIWKATKKEIDPDYPYTNFPVQHTVAFGVKVDL